METIQHFLDGLLSNPIHLACFALVCAAIDILYSNKVYSNNKKDDKGEPKTGA